MQIVQILSVGSGTATSPSLGFTVTTSPVSFSAPTTPGNFILACCWVTGASTSSTISSIVPTSITTIGQSLTFSAFNGSNWNNSTPGSLANGVPAFRYLRNAPSILTTTTFTLTAQMSGFGAGPFGLSLKAEFFLVEVSGISTTASYDAYTNHFQNSSSTVNPGTLTPSYTDAVFAIFSGQGSNISAGLGYNLLGSPASVAVIGQAQYKLGVPAGSVPTAFTGTESYWGSLALAFQAPPPPPNPTITSVSPTSGPSGGGQICTITGTNFNSDATVSFGGNLATNIVVVSPTEITCVTPVGFPGTVSVVVTEAAGTATLTNGYTYTASKIPLTMNFQDASGHPLSYGTVTFTLNTDAVTITGQQINAGRVVSFTLDVNGNLSGPLWPTDQMTADSISPNTTYLVKAYTAEGQLCFEQDMVIST